MEIITESKNTHTCKIELRLWTAAMLAPELDVHSHRSWELVWPLMRESGAELLGLHTAELYTVLPAEARALQNTRMTCKRMRRAAWLELRRSYRPNPRMKVCKSEENEEWKGLRSVSLSDNIETSAMFKQQRNGKVTAKDKLQMAWNLSRYKCKVVSQNMRRDWRKTWKHQSSVSHTRQRFGAVAQQIWVGPNYHFSETTDL